MNRQEPQSCSKCANLPEDILMLACGHDLCLNCAADRLAFELSKNRNANVISCGQCYEKTPLDSQSIQVLKSLTKGPQTPKHQTTIQKIGNKVTPASTYTKTSSLGIDRGLDRSAQLNNQQISQSKISSNQNFSSIPSKKICTEHRDEEILYFCFDCKCECICPECVIHGKHKDHDVKTVRKSQPIVKAQIQQYIHRFDDNAQILLQKKNQLQKQIRILSQRTNSSKSQIKQIFTDLHQKLSQKQKQLLSICDRSLQQGLSQVQKSLVSLNTKHSEYKQLTTNLYQSMKKQQITLLNYYSRKWEQLQQLVNCPKIEVLAIDIWNNQQVIAQLAQIGDFIANLGDRSRSTRTYA